MASRARHPRRAARWGGMTAARPVGADTIRPPNVAPAATQRSGRRGERRHSGGNELCRLRRSERSVTCADDVGRDDLGAPSTCRGCPRGRLRGRGPTRPGPPFLPEEMGGKKGRGASPPPGPPKRGFMATVGCDWLARTGRALPPASSAQVTDRSLRRKRQSSFPPLCLLSPPNPLRWASAGAPLLVSLQALPRLGRHASGLPCKP